MPHVSRTPPYRLHKPSGRAVATFGGRTHYLGKFNTPESRRKYAALLAEWNASGEQLPAGAGASLTVAEIAVAYLRHAEQFYRAADGTPTGETETLRHALRPLNRLYSKLPAEEFSPLKLRAVRDEMIRMGWVRSNINRQVHRLRRVFRWAESHEMLRADRRVYEALRTVEALKAGRSKAAESEPVKPVSQAMIDAVLPLVSPQVAAMIRLQLLTGMRPGEACMMRTLDVAIGGDVWTYTPTTHKNAYRGRSREIYLGPQCQEILRPWLREPGRAAEFLFSPAEAEAARIEALAGRRHKRTPSHESRMRRARGRHRRRPPGNRYNVAIYRRAIERACDAAFQLPAELAAAEGQYRAWAHKWTYERKKRPLKNETPAELWESRQAAEDHRARHRWSPGQLRHNAATRIRAKFGIEAAQMVLGHSEVSTTQIYAERDSAAVVRIMREVG